MDEFARAVVVVTATLAVIVGAVGWACLGWAWAYAHEEPPWGSAPHSPCRRV